MVLPFCMEWNIKIPPEFMKIRESPNFKLNYTFFLFCLPIALSYESQINPWPLSESHHSSIAEPPPSLHFTVLLIHYMAPYEHD